MARGTSQDRRTIEVSISIISKIPALPSLFCKRRGSFKYDEHATIFADRSHGLNDGSLCRLSVGNKEIPVILRLIDKEERNPIEVDASVPVYLSPCLAASLGLHWFQIRHKRTSACLEIMNDYSTVVEASHANVKEIGKLPPSPSFSSDFCDEYADSNKQQTKSNEDDAGLKQFFMYPAKLKNQTSSKALKPKPRQRLLTLGSIFATMSRDENSNHVRFYKVVGIQSLIQQEDVPSQHCTAFYVSPSTHLTLAPSSFENNNGLECRLPRPSMGASYLQSIQHAKNMFSDARGDLVPNGFENGGEKTTIFDASSVEIVHHPSTNAVANALYLLGASSTTNNVCRACRKLFVDPTPIFHPQFIHIIGGEDNHVSACVAEAADVMGMRYFRVDGLAAFWAHYNYLESYMNQADENSNRILTGQLNDKLQGLAAALKIACNSSPCVLHVVDIDEELLPTTGHGADTDGRKEEEQRILQVIHEAVLQMSGHKKSVYQSYIGSHKPSLKDSQDSSSLAAAPPLAVVFSGSTPLPSGPLISSLEQNSICVSTPNVDYARHLWDNNSDDTFALVSQMLMGLSASDIVFLRKKFVRRWNAEKEESRADDSEQLKSSAVSVMKSLLADLECTKAFTQTTSSFGNSSTAPLSSTSLPNVRWEDIGGLSSVREEIMDAVELPLNYPELFEGSRRSGILLFGPPGTGKTLVAKAVARECGIPFLSIKGPELLGSYVGESEANVRAVFEAARSAAASAVKPHTSDSGFESGRSYGGASVLFFDELDSLAPRRGDTGHGDGVMERVVATLLGELDRGTGGNEDRATKASKSDSPSPHVIVIGATNRPDLLDPSLLRPGRFDRLLYLGPANTKEACLQILLAQTRMFQFQDCDRTAVLGEAMKSFPPTLSGADLSAVASGALILALKRVCDNVEKEVQRINTSRGVDDKSDEAVDVYDVMDSWSDKQLQPIVLEEDFVHAAKDIVPSISEEDLKRFEVLRNQFSVL